MQKSNIDMEQSNSNKSQVDIVDMENTSEKIKVIAEQSEYGISLFGLVIGGVMLGVGVHYRDACPNGAALWLLVAGAMALVAQFLNFWAKTYQQFALKDSKITGKESLVMSINKLLTALVTLVELAILIYGSVVVFGAWSKWTHDIKDKNSKNYCDYTPMMFAFIILIVKWVFYPCIFVILCLMMCFSACCVP